MNTTPAKHTWSGQKTLVIAVNLPICLKYSLTIWSVVLELDIAQCMAHTWNNSPQLRNIKAIGMLPKVCWPTNRLSSQLTPAHLLLCPRIIYCTSAPYIPWGYTMPHTPHTPLNFEWKYLVGQNSYFLQRSSGQMRTTRKMRKDHKENEAGKRRKQE